MIICKKIVNFQIYSAELVAVVNFSLEMPHVLLLQQAAAKAIVCSLCRKSSIQKDFFFDMLPVPLFIRDKLKNCCSNNIISDVIYQIMACNIWLQAEGNYHEEYIRMYCFSLENVRDDLLPFILQKNGF